jgi:hypothetical protein
MLDFVTTAAGYVVATTGHWCGVAPGCGALFSGDDQRLFTVTTAGEVVYQWEVRKPQYAHDGGEGGGGAQQTD